jgi:rod shape-determining protein MreC
METLLSRYRNLTALLVLLGAQLLLLAYQVKSGKDGRLIRVWAVTAVTPLAKATESARSGTGGFLSNYVLLRDAREENERIKKELAQLKLQNQYLSTQLASSERAKALQLFQQTSPSKTIGARIIGSGTGLNSRTVYVDRGTTDGVKKDMAVITPDGIVGKVVSAYPTASLVMLATSNGFAAGVISQKNKARGTMKGLGSATCAVDYVPTQEKVEAGEVFYTTGYDRIFPRGLPAGIAKAVKDGKGGLKEITLEPVGMRGELEEVLIVVEGVHGTIPDPSEEPSRAGIQLLPQPPLDAAATPVEQTPTSTRIQTDADRLREQYKRIGDSQGHQFGGSPYRTPDFNRQPPPAPAQPAPAPAPEAAKQPGGAEKQ